MQKLFPDMKALLERLGKLNETMSRIEARMPEGGGLRLAWLDGARSGVVACVLLAMTAAIIYLARRK